MSSHRGWLQIPVPSFWDHEYMLGVFVQDMMNGAVYSTVFPEILWYNKISCLPCSLWILCRLFLWNWNGRLCKQLIYGLCTIFMKGAEIYIVQMFMPPIYPQKEKKKCLDHLLPKISCTYASLRLSGVIACQLYTKNVVCITSCWHLSILTWSIVIQLREVTVVILSKVDVDATLNGNISFMLINLIVDGSIRLCILWGNCHVKLETKSKSS